MTRPMNTNPLDHASLKIESQAMNNILIGGAFLTFEWLSYNVLIGLNQGLYHSNNKFH